jgi:class 3 adenylate cyclase
VTELPRGTVTFLFTDIEGSTRLLKRLGPRYAEVVDAQRRILRAAAAEHEGREVDTQGDSFFFAFPRAGGAIAAACTPAAARTRASSASPASTGRCAGPRRSS